jgi:hypothetical protein
MQSSNTPRQRLRRVPRHPGFWAPLAMLTAVGLLVLLLGPIAWWATPAKHLQGKDKADARNATRQVLLAAVGGLVLLTGAGFTARTYFLTRRGQLTDRYTKAIAQLASDKLAERLGGIYALEHLMAESERDHDTVVSVLAAFIREQARDQPPEPEWGVNLLGPRLANDVQAALTVLGRRPVRPEALPIDLSRADLRRADLHGLRFAHANFFRTDLRGADLDDSDLRHAELLQARLDAAWLRRAQLDGTRLGDVGLEKAKLSGAKLQGVFLGRISLRNTDLQGADLRETEVNCDLTGAKLDGAQLHGADLRHAEGLTPLQIRSAKTNDATRLPDGL